MNDWATATNIKQIADGEIQAELRADFGSPWFDGHFPGYPVLPGIAQLHAVLEAIRKIEGENLKIESVGRVRFKQIIKPGDSPLVIVKRNTTDKLSFSFKIMLGDKVACSGSMVVDRGDER